MRFSKPIVTRALLTLFHAIFTVGPVVGAATDEAGWTRDRSFTPAIVRHRSSLEFNTMDDIKLPGVTGRAIAPYWVNCYELGKAIR